MTTVQYVDPTTSPRYRIDPALSWRTDGPVRVGVVIPALNPGDALERLVEDFFTTARRERRAIEVVVVDDGSTDGSIDRLAVREGLVVLRGENHGKGAALRAGLEASCAGVRGFIDADGAYSATSLLEMVDVLERGGYDAVVGRRFGARRSLARMVGTAIFSAWVRLWCGLDFDTQAGCKAFSGAMLDDLLSKSQVDGFAIDVEMLVLARRGGWKAPARVPLRVCDGAASSTVTLRRTMRALAEVVALRQPRRARGTWGSRYVRTAC
jgi:hypothetical protein